MYSSCSCTISFTSFMAPEDEGRSNTVEKSAATNATAIPMGSSGRKMKMFLAVSQKPATFPAGAVSIWLIIWKRRACGALTSLPTLRTISFRPWTTSYFIEQTKQRPRCSPRAVCLLDGNSLSRNKFNSASSTKQTILVMQVSPPAHNRWPPPIPTAPSGAFSWP